MTAAAYSEDYDQLPMTFGTKLPWWWRPDLQTESSPASLIDYCKQRSQSEQRKANIFTAERY